MSDLPNQEQAANFNVFFLGQVLKECIAAPEEEQKEVIEAKGPEKLKRREIEMEDRRIVEYSRQLMSEIPQGEEGKDEREKREMEYKKEAEARQGRRNKLEKIYEQEIEYSKINRMKLLYDWKIIMRIAKVDEIRKYLTLYMQIFERDLDDKDAILQMIDRDILEAEDHYNIALTNHFIHVKQLVQLQDSRIKGLFKEFEIDVNELETEFSTEFNELKEHFLLEQKEINRMYKNIFKEYKQKFELIKKEFQETQSTNQQKINEEYSRLQESIRKAASETHATFTAEMTEIKQKAEEDNKKDAKDIAKLVSLDKEVNILKKKFDKQTEDLKQIRIKIKQNNEDWDSKNESLKSEKEKIMTSYRFLKNKLKSFRNNQKEKLKKLVKNSFDCETKLKNFIKLAEKILKLAEISRRLEIEQEKIMPYYENSNKKEEGTNEENNEKEPFNILGVDPNLFEEIEALQNFWKRFNKVKLVV